MNKTERYKKQKEGYVILRTQYDAKTEKFKIVKHTNRGGWERFGSRWHNSQQEAEVSIDNIIKLNTNIKYLRDE